MLAVDWLKGRTKDMYIRGGPMCTPPRSKLIARHSYILMVVGIGMPDTVGCGKVGVLFIVPGPQQPVSPGIAWAWCRRTADQLRCRGQDSVFRNDLRFDTCREDPPGHTAGAKPAQ